MSYRILLTGGCGFIGSHVVRALLSTFDDILVVNFDKLDYCSNINHLKEFDDDPRYVFVKGDILEPHLVSYILEHHAINTVMHFAAQTHVDNSFGNSLSFTRNNVEGTHVLLEACRTYGSIKRFIHVSTDEVYGTADSSTPGRCEDAVLAPTNPYSASKAAAEMVVRAYHTSYGLPVIITRGNNVYGPGQFPEKIIPKFLLQIMRDIPLTIHGTGENARHYIHVRDVAKAFIKILCHGEIGSTYNIGVEDEKTNLEVAHTLLTLMDKPLDFLRHVEDRKFNDFRYPVNSSRLHSLGWSPTISWEDGLAETIEWYRANVTDYWPKEHLARVTDPHPSL